MANGNVFVFNLYNETLQLILNGMHAGSVPGSSRATQPPYTPASVSTRRVLNASDAAGCFVNRNNHVLLQWPSGDAGMSLSIDGSQFPISQDLSLYIARNQWFLLSQYGVIAMSGQIG